MKKNTNYGPCVSKILYSTKNFTGLSLKQIKDGPIIYKENESKKISNIVYGPFAFELAKIKAETNETITIHEADEIEKIYGSIYNYIESIKVKRPELILTKKRSKTRAIFDNKKITPEDIESKDRDWSLGPDKDRLSSIFRSQMERDYNNMSRSKFWRKYGL